MSWKQTLTLLLGGGMPFSFGVTDVLAQNTPETANADQLMARDLFTFSDPANDTRLFQLARHRSHSSHSSHSSHRSHYSGSGGGSYTPAPIYRPPPPPVYRAPPVPAYTPPSYSPPPSRVPQTTAAPSTRSTLRSLTRPGTGVTEPRAETAAAPLLGAEPASAPPRMSAVEMEAFIRRLQVALLVQGYDPGPVNGVLGLQTQAALKLFQGAMALTVTGYMDRDTLKGLGLLP